MVIPVHTGIRVCSQGLVWIPAFAGMTEATAVWSPENLRKAETVRKKVYEELPVILKMNSEEAKKFVDGIYRQVAERWRERVSSAPFMKALASGNLPKETFRLFFKNWAGYTIEINTLEAASYHKHIHFFRKHRDLMAAMAEKLADELIHPKPPGHIHVVVETAKALGISEDEVFVSPMLAEFRAKIDYFRAILWEGTVAEFYAAGATEEQFGHWAGEVFTALTTHYGLTPEQAVYFSLHEEADTREHEGGIMGHGDFRKMVLRRLLEEFLSDWPSRWQFLSVRTLRKAWWSATTATPAFKGPCGRPRIWTFLGSMA